MIRVLLADDHAPFRNCVKTLLTERAEFAVLGDHDNGRALLDAFDQLDAAARPQVVIVDVRMPVLDGIEVARALAQRAPALPVLALSSHDDPALVRAFVRAGGRGYMLKGDPLAGLVEALHALAAGRTWFSASLDAQALGNLHPQYPHSADVPGRRGGLS